MKVKLIFYSFLFSYVFTGFAFSWPKDSEMEEFYSSKDPNVHWVIASVQGETIEEYKNNLNEAKKRYQKYDEMAETIELPQPVIIGGFPIYPGQVKTRQKKCIVVTAPPNIKENEFIIQKYYIDKLPEKYGWSLKDVNACKDGGTQSRIWVKGDLTVDIEYGFCLKPPDSDVPIKYTSSILESDSYAIDMKKKYEKLFTFINTFKSECLNSGFFLGKLDSNKILNILGGLYKPPLDLYSDGVGSEYCMRYDSDRKIHSEIYNMKETINDLLASSIYEAFYENSDGYEKKYTDLNERYFFLNDNFIKRFKERNIKYDSNSSLEYEIPGKWWSQIACGFAPNIAPEKEHCIYKQQWNANTKTNEHIVIYSNPEIIKCSVCINGNWTSERKETLNKQINDFYNNYLETKKEMENQWNIFVDFLNKQLNKNNVSVEELVEYREYEVGNVL